MCSTSFPCAYERRSPLVMSLFTGIHGTALIVPPGNPALSSSTTLAPSRLALTAAPSPAGPDPHTTTS